MGLTPTTSQRRALAAPVSIFELGIASGDPAAALRPGANGRELNTHSGQRLQEPAACSLALRPSVS